MDQQLLRQAYTIRALELALLELFSQRKIFGTVHTCVGQEIGAVTLCSHLQKGVDALFATHRGHGLYLAMGGSLEALVAEMAGYEGALCSGHGGTQHLHFPNFYSNGIQGSGTLHAVGFAWAQKLLGSSGIAVAQLGDGTLGEGAVYEAFTFASLLSAPVLFFLEWNGYAQSTDTRETTPGEIETRAHGFGIESARMSDCDPDALAVQLGKVIDRVRKTKKPFLQIVDTRRLLAHSKGDDNRAREILDAQWAEDPLTLLADDSLRAQAEQEVKAMIDRVFSQKPLQPRITLSAYPDPESALNTDMTCGSDGAAARTVVERLNTALHRAMELDSRVIVIGEDLKDPYGGAFKVTRGLSTKFPDRVFSSPIAEAGIAGVANGAAMAGMRPVTEIMFADFVTLAADQLINAAAKVFFMYGGNTVCPIVCRVVSGAGRGYGPTHSQSLESLFCGIPGLRVVALSARHDPEKLLTACLLHDRAPTVFAEHKSLYPMTPLSDPPLGLSKTTVSDVPETCFAPLTFEPENNRKADVTVVTYGGSVAMVEQAIRELMIEDEIYVDYIVQTQLWPLVTQPIEHSVKNTGRLVVIEESIPTYGFSAAVITQVLQSLNSRVVARAVGQSLTPIPSARDLEDFVLPSVESIKSAIRAVIAN